MRHFGNWARPGLRRQMKMVAHQIEGMHPVAGAGGSLGEQRMEEVVVAGCK